jgi:hypothetical protein
MWNLIKTFRTEQYPLQTYIQQLAVNFNALSVPPEILYYRNYVGINEGIVRKKEN